MRAFLTYAVATMMLYAGWAFFAKLATQTIPAEQSVIYTYGIGIIVAFSYHVITDTSLMIVPRGIGFSLIAGLFIALGTISYYLALNSGPTSVATSISGMYILGTTVLAVIFLGESLSFPNLVGICLAIGAVVLLAQ